MCDDRISIARVFLAWYRYLLRDQQTLRAVSIPFLKKF